MGKKAQEYLRSRNASVPQKGLKRRYTALPGITEEEQKAAMSKQELSDYTAAWTERGMVLMGPNLVEACRRAGVQVFSAMSPGYQGIHHWGPIWARALYQTQVDKHPDSVAHQLTKVIDKEKVLLVSELLLSGGCSDMTHAAAVAFLKNYE